VQKNLGAPQKGLATQLDKLSTPVEKPESGGSDDIGDISWTLPTVSIYYPANIPELPGHHWSNAISMATPVAHKGVVAGSKVVAMTMVDVLTRPDLRAQAKDYFVKVQTKDQKYVPMLAASDKPPIEINTEVMAKYRPEMRKYYYDQDRYPTYLDQLGIKWPPAELSPPKGAAID
jgi:aminobenzoyl-glutamate utilization protein B